jgi:hypothetical protein
VTARAADTLTIVRTQEGTAARTIVVGDRIVASVTKKWWDDVEALASILYLPMSIYGTPGYAVDNTTTAQAWLDDAALMGKQALLTPGEWRVGALNLPHGIVVQGVAPGGYELEVDDEYRGRLVMLAGMTDNLITLPAGRAHAHLRDLMLDGTPGTSGNLVHVTDVGTAVEAQLHVTNCYLVASKGHGVYVGANRRACKIKDTSIISSATDGVHIQSSDTTVMQCIIGGSGASGVLVGDSIAKIISNEIYGNVDGITVETGVPGFTIVDNGVDRNTHNGVLVNSGASGAVVANILHQNSVGNTGTYHHVNLASGVGRVTITGNALQSDGVSATAGYGIFLANAADLPNVVFSNNVQENANCTVDGMYNIQQATVNSPTAADVGCIAYNFDPATAVSTSTPLPTSGVLYLQRIRLDETTRVTNIHVYVQTAGATLTANQCSAALYTSAAALITNSTVGNQATAWQSTGYKTMAMAAVQVLNPGYYWVALWANGTTRPAFSRGNSNPMVNGGLATANSRFATSNTAITTTPPGTLGARTAASTAYWVGLS